MVKGAGGGGGGGGGERGYGTSAVSLNPESEGKQ